MADFQDGDLIMLYYGQHGTQPAVVVGHTNRGGLRIVRLLGSFGGSGMRVGAESTIKPTDDRIAGSLPTNDPRYREARQTIAQHFPHLSRGAVGEPRRARAQERNMARANSSSSTVGIEIRISEMPIWEQIGGDMSPDKYGGTFAKSDGDSIELLKIQPVREYVGDDEAADVGYPFWTREAYYDLSDLDPSRDEVRKALGTIDMDLRTLSEDFNPTQRALVIAEALLDYGSGADEGPSGWSEDIYGDAQVKPSYGGKITTFGELLAEEDEEFRREILEEDDEDEDDDDDDDEDDE